MPPFERGLVICDLGQKHRVLYSKYSLFKNHLLVVTQ
jgi:ATP adenylyltransferase/5',5'''-P-1,P-4-tetraphosphate phosphorylase II